MNELKSGHLYLGRWKLQLALFGIFCVLVGIFFAFNLDPRFAFALGIIPLSIVAYKIFNGNKRIAQDEDDEQAP